jgi:mRNA-degrading endonuclease toxin of MazEF toxin-antitoxin module
VPKAKRGDIWMADLGLATKVRPVLVLSVAYEGQERAIVSYVIRTTSLRDTQYEVRDETGGMPNGAFDAQVWVRYRRSNSKGEWDSSTLRR